jgi:hypothetical protein
MRRRLCLILILLFTGLNTTFAGQVVKLKVIKAKVAAKPAVLVRDTSNINARHFSTDALSRYRSQPEFKYQDETNESPSIWTRFWRWFWHWLRSLFQRPTVKGKPALSIVYVILMIIKYLAILAAIGLIVFVIFKMVGVDLSFLFRRRSKAIAIPYTESSENIHDINFDGAIEEAVNNHNYRLAVRLLYLKCLKQLSDASLIKWQPEKTNSSYVNELSNAEQKVIFNSLTRRFEFIWYGEFAIDGQTYNKINLQFQEFKGKIA